MMKKVGTYLKKLKNHKSFYENIYFLPINQSNGQFVPKDSISKTFHVIELSYNFDLCDNQSLFLDIPLNRVLTSENNQ